MSVDTEDDHFTQSADLEQLMAVVIQGALRGNIPCRRSLPTLSDGFEEPYKSLAEVICNELRASRYVDRAVIQAGISGRRFLRRSADGQPQLISAEMALGLIPVDEVVDEQLEAFIGLLEREVEKKVVADFQDRVKAAVAGANINIPEAAAELREIISEATRYRNRAHATEALRFFPYFQKLLDSQTSRAFTGLDSGFSHINKICNGLESGLAVIAAPPAQGKTTLVWQMCQQVAQLNQVPVIFVSMEQSAEELRAKSIARFGELNTRHISRGGFNAQDSGDQAKLREAGELYFRVAMFLTVLEGSDSITVDGMGDLAESQMVKLGADRCLIAIDFLQILPVPDSAMSRNLSQKDRVDLHVSSLRRLARRLNSPVIAISSENRSGYMKKGLDVFKESGGIEYSADIAAVMTRDKEGTRAANGAYRVIDFNIVKNRNGETATVKFRFYPERATFVETQREALPEPDSE